MPRLAALAVPIALAALSPATIAQHALLRRDHDLFAVPAPPGLRAAIETLLAGPTPAQREAGIDTDVPAGTALVALALRDGAAMLTLSAAFADASEPAAHLEDAVEQIAKTAFDAAPLRSVSIRVQMPDRAVTLDELVERAARHRAPATGAPPGPPPGPPRQLPPSSPPPAGAAFGALSGKTIAVSPGHGWYWHSTLGWTTQRPTIGGLTEDFHTNEIAMHFLIPALENLGARVISVRERGEILHERIGDNDHGAPAYVETGVWTTSASNGYSGGTYRFAGTAAAESATATWTLAIPADGMYPVHAFFRASSNRAPDARFRVHHSGGVDEVSVDQTKDDLRWVHLGDWWFTAAQGAVVVLSNQSSVSGRVVIADAVRAGAGYGSIVRGGGASGKPRWQECCRYWAEYAGAPASVYDISGCSDDCDDVTARPKYAEWRGADGYVSLHTNAGGGSGTSSYIHDTSPTPGSAAWQRALHDRLIADIRAEYDPTWIDRGKLAANFGEVRELATMPGVLIELAFHDVPGSKDHEALQDPRFRFVSGRAIARGVLRYFAPSAAFPPDPPVELWVTQDGTRGLRVAWSPAPGATGYSVEQSPDGKGFAEIAQTTATSWTTGPLPHGTTSSFRVRAFNSSGRSFPTEVLTAGTSHLLAAEVLLVQGFDRFDKYVTHRDNSRDYLRLHGDALRRPNEFSLGFDAANNEAVLAGRVALSPYRAVDWLLGEESTADETFSDAEQALVRAYVQSGGRLLVSGAEVGWDLDAHGSASDRAFYHQVLGAQYVSDDAGTYSFTPSGGIFAGLPGGTFDDGTNGTYNVDYPDVIAAADALSAVDVTYATGGGAGLERDTGAGRVVYLGFPLETIVDPGLRGQVMARALRFLLAPRALENGPAVVAGGLLPLVLTLPAEPGATYVLASALGLGTIPLPGGTGILPLQVDPVLTMSLSNVPAFAGFLGALNAGGQAVAAFAPPALSILRGADFYFSGLTVTPSFAVQTLLPWTRARVQ